MNGFWLSHDSDKYPTLVLLVNGELATLLYVPRESHPGFTPTGGIEGLDKNGTTTFSIDTAEQETKIWNQQVVAFSTALSVAKEFFDSKELPINRVDRTVGKFPKDRLLTLSGGVTVRRAKLALSRGRKSLTGTSPPFIRYKTRMR